MTLADTIIYGAPTDVKRLIDEGADVNELDIYGFYPILETAIVNNVEKAQLILDAGANINQADVTGRTALHWAVDNNNVQLTKFLLERKANPNVYSSGGQSPLVFPLLRGQNNIKKILYQYKANLNFAQDFINTKLLGHRYQLRGYVDIVNHEGRFLELDYDGFFLDCTIDIIRNSLARFVNNFSAKHLRHYFNYLKIIIERFVIAAELIKFQQYTLKIQDYENIINHLLNNELLLIPIAYEGHGVSFVKYKNLLIKCDRGENSKIEGSVVIYQVNNMSRLTPELFKYMLYKRHTKQFVHEELTKILGLVPVGHLPIPPQIIGNCSWANVEASVAAMLFVLMLKTNNTKQEVLTYRNDAMAIYNEWLEWDKDRALEECLQSFKDASKARKASKAAILGAVLLQKCHYQVPKHVKNAERILSILTTPDYEYVLKSYVDVFWKKQRTPAGKNLMQLLDDCGVKV